MANYFWDTLYLSVLYPNCLQNFEHFSIMDIQCYKIQYRYIYFYVHIARSDTNKTRQTHLNTKSKSVTNAFAVFLKISVAATCPAYLINFLLRVHSFHIMSRISVDVVLDVVNKYFNERCQHVRLSCRDVSRTGGPRAHPF